jgi:hypothetical protein
VMVKEFWAYCCWWWMVRWRVCENVLHHLTSRCSQPSYSWVVLLAIASLHCRLLMILTSDRRLDVLMSNLEVIAVTSTCTWRTSVYVLVGWMRRWWIVHVLFTWYRLLFDSRRSYDQQFLTDKLNPNKEVNLFLLILLH